MVRQIVRLRWRHRLGPVQIAGQLGVPASTVHAVLVGCRINRLSHIDRVTGEPLRRYEHPHPGSLIHVDLTKFGNIPLGGGHRFLGRQQGDLNKRASRPTEGRGLQARTGKAFVHTVIDDHSRVAYTEICTDEKAATAIAVLRRAIAWFAERGVRVERVLCDIQRKAAIARSPGAWPARSLASSTTGPGPTGHKTNGKLERFHRTLGDGWAVACQADGTTSLPRAWDHLEVGVSITVPRFLGQRRRAG